MNYIANKLPSFTLTKTNPFDWKDCFLSHISGELKITPKSTWYLRSIRHLTSTSLYDISSLKKIRQVFQEKIDYTLRQKLTLDEIFTANKNIACLNEKITRYNAHYKPDKQIALLHELVLPPFRQQRPSYQIPSDTRLAGLSTPIDSHKPDTDKAHAWVQAQHASLQPVAYKVAESILNNFVSFPRFIAALDESYQKALDAIGSKPYGHITWSTSRGSSGPWVESLIRHTRKPTAKYQLENKNSNVITKCTHYQKKGKKITQKPVQSAPSCVRDWILCDDASYSGTQLFIIIAEIKKRLQNSTKSTHLHIVIPYVSAHVVQKLQAPQYQSPHFKVVLHHTHIMPTVADVTKDLSQEDREMAEFFIDTISRQPFACTTYFAHKVGDGLSLPRSVSDGKVWERSYKYMKKSAILEEAPRTRRPLGLMPFIPEFEPHYREKR